MGNGADIPRACEVQEGSAGLLQGFYGARKWLGVLLAAGFLGCGEGNKNTPADAGNKPDTTLPDKGGKKDGNIPISDDSLPPKPDKGGPDKKLPDGQVPDKRVPDLTPPKPDAGIQDQKPPDSQVPDAYKPDLDITPPPAPVITTNNGLPWDPGKSDITIEGTCDTGDTFKMQVRDNKTDPAGKGKSTTPPWVDITYTPGTGKWSYPTKVSPYDPHWFEFRAVDKANNAGSSDILFVEWDN